MSKRMRLRRADGKVYLDRRGFECRWFGIYLHHIGAPDPGNNPHDHPWWFASLILSGAYLENIIPMRDCQDRIPGSDGKWYGTERWRPRWSLRTIRLDQGHQITHVEPNTWTLVIRGPRVRRWGFATRDGWIYWEHLPREDRDLSTEENL